MRNVWAWISGQAVAATVVVVVITIGAGAYYFVSRQWTPPPLPDSGAPQMPPVDGQVLVVPAGNPLLTADARQFGMWIPVYPIRCGEILFEKDNTKAQHFAFCIGEIKRRVARATAKQLSREDVLDPRVKAHWHEVMRGQ